MAEKVNIEGLDRADVLRVLYDGSKPLGLGVLDSEDKDMSKAEAVALVHGQESFDYVKGRVMKVYLREGDTELDPRLYDRDNGAGAAARLIDALKVPKAVLY